jgi:hypothetical protein
MEQTHSTRIPAGGGMRLHEFFGSALKTQVRKSHTKVIFKKKMRTALRASSALHYGTRSPLQDHTRIIDFYI